MPETQPMPPSRFISHAADVASFYGFRSMKDIERRVPKAERPHNVHSFITTTQTCVISMGQRPNEPLLAFYATPAPAYIPTTFTLLPKETGEFGLHVMGSPESLGEVLLLKTLVAIVSEWGGAVRRIRINALGDRDSKARFERELSLYLRKHAPSLDEVCRNNLAKNPLLVYACQNEMCHQIIADAPRPVNFLSEKSRVHFREVLEHIERLGFPYELDDLLVGDDREPRILFAIDLAEEDQTVLATLGGRYDEYLRRISGKKDGAAVSASIFFRKKGVDRSHFTALPIQKTPRVFFIQLGVRAKLEGLCVLDMLRRAQVPVSQSFSATSLGPQLATAKELGVSHLLIMGQREALDGTIIVRSAGNNSQTTLDLGSLPRFLKTIRV